MADQILLYLSAALDLDAERDLISRSTTEIPTTLGWRIIQTPRHSVEPDLNAIQTADIHLLLLGSDIRAPIGFEWLVARRSGRTPVMFLKKDILRTPAAHAFMREIETHTDWRAFVNLADLRQQVLILLGDHILDQALHYALRPKELGDLQAWRKELELSKPAPIEETPTAAGDNSIIFSKERYIPSQGILIQNKQ